MRRWSQNAGECRALVAGLAGLAGILGGVAAWPLRGEQAETRCAEAGDSRTVLRQVSEQGGDSSAATAAPQRPMEHVQLAEGGRGFILAETRRAFRPWGFNYDHDERGRLLEDYWETEWDKVEQDFAEMRALGANCVRIHLQFGKFMESADKPNAAALRQLERLLRLAERQQLYLDLTGLACYHKKDVPAWYDALDEAERWQAQSRFWTAVAERAARSPAVFCYDLMNEPVVPGGQRERGGWLAPPFGDKHFVQFITLDQRQRPRPDIARAWVRQLVQAIRRVDRRHLITVGLVDWSLDRPGLTSGFVPQKIVSELDFLAVHLYPHKGKLDQAMETLRGFAVGKPVVVEEAFPLWCSVEELEQFVEKSEPLVSGWFFFYWGRTVEELAQDKDLGSALLRAWLERFRKRARLYALTPPS
jgi:hypothetical protein